MKNRLNHYYLNPESYGYQVLHHLQQHGKKGALLLPLLLLAYPVAQWFSLSAQQHQLDQALVAINEQMTQHTHQQQRLMHDQQANQQKSRQFSTLNQQLQQQLQHHQAQIERIQWHFDHGTQVQIVATLHHRQLFSLLTALNRLDHLAFSQLHLQKQTTDSVSETKVQIQALLSTHSTK